MKSWLVILVAGLLLTLVFVRGLLLFRHKCRAILRGQNLTEDTWLLYLLLWLASLSMLAYIAFAFGKR